MTDHPDIDAVLARVRPAEEVLLVGTAVVVAELLALWVYVAVADVTVLAPRYLLYPLAWINVGLWALYRTDPAPAGRNRRLVAGAVAAGYLAVLSVVGGLVGPGFAFQSVEPAFTGVVVEAGLPPGFGPAVLYQGALVSVVLLPFKVVGYLALAYLVFATVLDAAGSAAAGVLGLFSCVSCVLPLLASWVSGVVGGTAAVVVTAYAGSQSYDLSTLVFVVTVALLYWRPTVGWWAARGSR